MKANIKRLALFVMIAATGMFLMVGTASADDHRGKNTIYAKYAVTGAGHNLVSTTGFDKDYKPNPCPPDVPPEMCMVFQDIQIFSGDLTFYKDGTGILTERNRGIDMPPLEWNLKEGTFEFIWTMTSGRRFTFQMKPDAYWTAAFKAGGQTGQIASFDAAGYCEGVFSEDWKNLNVTCGPPNLILTAVDPATGTKFPIQALFSQSIVGILVHE